MIKFTKLLLFTGLLCGLVLPAWADRGIGRKTKGKVLITTTSTAAFKGRLALNLTSGLKYTGSLLNNNSRTINTSFANTAVTYQKGNTIYIMPYKQKVVVPDMQKGYSGLKLIIRHR